MAAFLEGNDELVVELDRRPDPGSHGRQSDLVDLRQAGLG
jgi:hypothetical protein